MRITVTAGNLRKGGIRIPQNIPDEAATQVELEDPVGIGDGDELRWKAHVRFLCPLEWTGSGVGR